MNFTAKPEIAKNLDAFQLKATEAPPGNTLVMAVAGSGKTTLLTRRVANLIDHGIDPSQILLLTFTNQAADEMKERIGNLLGEKAGPITAGTFHSVANSMLKLYDTVKMQVIDTDEQKQMLQKILSGLFPKGSDNAKTLQNVKNSHLLSLISQSKNEREDLKRLLRRAFFSNCSSILYDIYRVCDIYEEKKTSENLRDFDDLTMDVLSLLKENPDARKHFRSRYQYIFVDEYQDINWMQHDFLKILNQTNNHLFVVGDRNQCIYQFRGARDSYMESFEQEFPGTKVYFLKKNYRSRPEVLEAANKTLAHSPYRYKLSMIPNRAQGKNPSVRFQVFPSQAKEQESVSKTISYFHNHFQIPYSDMAVLLRNNRSAKDFDAKLSGDKVPCKLVGLLGFFERKHIKILLDLFRLFQNKKNSLCFEKTARLFPNIGEKTSAGLLSLFRKHHNSFREVFEEENLKSSEKRFFKLMAELEGAKTPVALAEIFLDCFFMDYLKNTFSESYSERMEDVGKFLQKVQDAKDIDEFFDSIILRQGEDDEEEKKDAVKIMTIHKAKGKEWPVLFLPNLAEAVIPGRGEEQHERNVFYVSLTRAKDFLFLSYSQNKEKDKKKNYQIFPAKESTFLKEIQAEKYRRKP